MAKRASARGIRRDVSGSILRAPRRMQADAVSLYARANGAVTPFHGIRIGTLRD